MGKGLCVAGRTVRARQRLPADVQRQLVGGRDQLCLQAGAFVATLQRPGQSVPRVRGWHGNLLAARSIEKGDGRSGLRPAPSSVWLKIRPGKDRLNGQRGVFCEIAGVVHTFDTRHHVWMPGIHRMHRIASCDATTAQTWAYLYPPAVTQLTPPESTYAPPTSCFIEFAAQPLPVEGKMPKYHPRTPREDSDMAASSIKHFLPSLAVLVGAVLLGAVPPAVAQDAGAAGLDLYGDPLPSGAIARLGTVRLRHGGNLQCVTFAPDGKTMVTGGG